MTRVVIAFVSAMLAAAVVGSIIQTQLNLSALVELSVAVSFQTRISTIIHDLLHFSPLFGAIVSAVMLIALPLAYAIAKGLKHEERWWFIGAGFIGMLVCFWLVNSLVPMPTLIAATRSWPGLLAMSMTGALAGWVFGRLWHPTPKELQEPVI
ncbi:hypothetical protein PSI9734_01307 [Pseudidiomarina piscicola]|uniref:Uncharacterized protein n=1 Tax=Pseudidiomarina piscicola TaxID=2614830 RepID=A0A6S6WM93_9GAMM|nr:hypothetical protein [Pseudidiomarina piscicola]CAB0150868.1 hypothetical protein PSI9734_01307 [Pseudidiomarina piscicola]VZT40373.1 hypothetical protein PSI9734_01307 [Pseudomonas aeruginosa]